MFSFKPLRNARSLLIKLIYFIYFFILLEGCLRKWVFPNYYAELYFLKDIFLIFTYIFSIKYNFFLKNKFEKLFFILIVLISLYGCIGYVLNKDNFIAYALGLRAYWIYLPLTFIIANALKTNDFTKFIKINLYIAIPYFFLILFQSYSSSSSIINLGYNSLVLNPERPSGFFTYTTQNTFYLIFLLVCYYIYILNIKTISKKDILYILFLNFILITILILLKSRAVYFYWIVILTSSILSLFYINQKSKLKKKKFLIIIVSSLLFFILSSQIFSKQFYYSKNRINTDIYTELSLVKKFRNSEFLFFSIEDFCKKNSSLCRIIDLIYPFSEIKSTTLAGYGIGSGTASVSTFLKKKPMYLGENENYRILEEMGYIFGSIIITIKCLFIFYLLIIFFKNKIFLLIPLLLFICIQLLIGNITHSSTFSSFIFWLSLGLLMSDFKNRKIKFYKY